MRFWMGTLVLLACGVGCSSTSKTGPDEPDACLDCDMSADVESDVDTSDTADMANNTLPSLCVANARGWQNGQSAFKDVSEAWGLKAINPIGSRISVADVDGDGLPDVFVRRAGRDNFEENTRVTWLLRNTGNGFEDITQSSGIVSPRLTPPLGRPAEVAVFGDMNNDGHIDAVTAASNDGTGFEGMEVMYGQGDGTFVLGPLMPFHRGQTAVTVGGLTLTDVNRDGLLDVFIGQGAVANVPQQDLLFRQTPSGFEDATASLGLTTSDWVLDALNTARAHTNSWSTAACDLNNDGTPDLLSASYGRAPNHLWRSSVEGYLNLSIASGYAFDNNQDWTLSHGARCYCQANPTATDCNLAPDPLYSCAGARAWNHDRDRMPFRLGGNSGTTVCADLNNDGALDLVTTEIVHSDVGGNSDPSDILINDGLGIFTRPGHELLGLTKPRTGNSWDDGDITAAVFDFDNDGRNDILIASTDYPGTRAHLYWQRPDGTFQRMVTTEGIDMLSAHGVVVADFDQDGDLDILIGHSANRCSLGEHCYPAESRHVRLFENTIGNQSNWVQLRLQGSGGTNRAAIGARVTVRRGDVVQVQEVGGGHGHYGLQNDLLLHFGLGTDCTAEVTIRWPDANLTEQTVTLQAGYQYTVVRGEEPVAQVE